MTRELMFKLRLDAEDRKRLDDLAVFYAAPAATVVRMLIKRAHDDVRIRGTERFEMEPHHEAIVQMFVDSVPRSAETIAHEMAQRGFNFEWNIPRALNDLRRANYLEKTGGMYRPRPLALALFLGDKLKR